jgi:hypothetical protein
MSKVDVAFGGSGRDSSRNLHYYRMQAGCQRHSFGGNEPDDLKALPARAFSPGLPDLQDVARPAPGATRVISQQTEIGPKN